MPKWTCCRTDRTWSTLPTLIRPSGRRATSASWTISSGARLWAWASTTSSQSLFSSTLNSNVNAFLFRQPWEPDEGRSSDCDRLCRRVCQPRPSSDVKHYHRPREHGAFRFHLSGPSLRLTACCTLQAGQGDVLGSRFEDLRDIIALVEDKDRVGVCIDTCSSFALSPLKRSLA